MIALALLAAPLAMAQAVAPAADPAPTASGDDVIELTPFNVDASKDKGYFAENTLAGSRMNTNIGDLASSISVITKQQIEDTASVDINDVFRYEINTEGSSTYMPTGALGQTFRADGIADVVAGTSKAGSDVQTNAGANRVRGIGTPSQAVNYYPAVASVPMDAYNLASLEISRGPNSMLFGMGSPAGIVNQTTASATLNKNFGSASMRFDDRGSVRSTLAFNRSIVDKHLALYGAMVVDERRFERKPSYDNTHRAYGALTWKPFSGTTIRANIEAYRNSNRRPNNLTPRDFVTQWNLAGKPVYDALTRTVTKTTTGQLMGYYVYSATSPFANEPRDFIATLPGYDVTKWNAAKTTYNGISIYGEAALTNTASILYVPGMSWVNQPRSTQVINNGALLNWFQPLYGRTYPTQWGTATNPTATAPNNPTEAQILANASMAGIYNRDYSVSAGWNGPGAAMPGYHYPGVTDKSIYNWEDININQMNFGEDRNKSYNVDLEQKITNDLYLNLGYFRQNFRSVQNYTMAQLNVATLYIDSNKYLPDGTTNPFLGKVYVEDTDPDQGVSSEDHSHYRAMLAWTPDFTRNKNWTKWLGRHQVLGLYSKQTSMLSFIRRRMNFVDSTTQDGKYRYMANQNNNLDGTPSGWNTQTTSLRRAFYLASPSDANGVVTQSSGEWNVSNYTGAIKVYDYAANAFKTVTMTQEYRDFDASTGRNYREIASLSAGMTNYLFNERLVTTFGIRKDDYKARATTNDIIKDETGATIAPKMTNAEKWVYGVYQTDTVFNRWNRWDRLSGTTNTMGGVFKPFKNYTSIESRANGSQLWQIIRDFGISFNKSDNFNAPSVAQVDAFGKPLPKPTGEGKDIGLQFSALDNKLFARVTWFTATNENERSNPGTSISRLTSNVDTTLFRNWARTIAMINMGMNPTLSTFGTLSTTEETAVQAAAERIWQMPYTYYDSVGSIYATRNAEAKGVEAQINYNPMPNWTLRLTAGKQTTRYSKVMTEFDAWYAVRNPVWQNAKAADYLLPQYQGFATYNKSDGTPVNLTTFMGSYGYRPEILLNEVNGNYNAQLYYNNVVAPQAALNRDLDGQIAPGQRRYRWAAMTNYNVREGLLKGWNFGGSQRWEDKSVIGYYGKDSSGSSKIAGFKDVSDVSKPIFDSDNWYTDLWVGYARKICKGTIGLKIQLNVDDVFESGGLKVNAVNLDGSPYSYRIVDPRTFKLTTTFEF